jgi:NAD(P)-dependent dehydrogenase (short-subunit alcohol dehydrogenase family)
MSEILEDKVAVITGGSSGIGAATVQLFLEEGAKVVIADIQEPTEEIWQIESQEKVYFIRTDVTKENEIEQMIQAAEKVFGGLDILFNNAGASGSPAGILDMDSNDWDAIMALNLRASMLGMKYAVPLMRSKGGGAIINTSSIAGLRSGVSSVGYSVSKAALIHLTKMGAAEFAVDSIRVNAICPGTIPTAIFGQAFGYSREDSARMLPQIQDIFRAAQPVPRAGVPEDIAQMALFLASDASSFVTGQDITVDGGLLLQASSTFEADRPGGIFEQIFKLRDSVIKSTD